MLPCQSYLNLKKKKKKTWPELCKIVVLSKNMKHHLMYNMHKLNKGIGFYMPGFFLYLYAGQEALCGLWMSTVANDVITITQTISKGAETITTLS